jgi:ribosomal protein L24
LQDLTSLKNTLSLQLQILKEESLKEASIHISNVALVGKDGKAIKVGYKIEGDKKVRINKRNFIILNNMEYSKTQKSI